MNEVVPLSRRARQGLGSAGAWVRSALGSAWDWYTDLGQGAWLLTAAVLVVVGLGVAVVAGGHAEAKPCDQAAPLIQDISSAATRSAPLSAHGASVLHTDSTKLQAIAHQAYGSDASALRKAADVAGGARVGHPFHPELALQAYGAACDFSR